MNVHLHLNLRPFPSLASPLESSQLIGALRQLRRRHALPPKHRIQLPKFHPFVSLVSFVVNFSVTNEHGQSCHHQGGNETP